jgi:membrane-associated protein
VWVGTFVFAGYFFGNIPAVKERFTLVIMAILVLSVMPAVIEFIKHRRRGEHA